jgi:hypothetical protein
MKRWVAVFVASCALAILGLFAIDRLVFAGPPGFPGTPPPRMAVEPAVPSLRTGAGAVAGVIEATPQLKLNVPKVAAAAPMPGSAPSGDAVAAGRRRLTRSGTLALLVPNIERSVAAVRAVAAAQAGALTSLDDEHPGSGDAGRDATVELSVPADRFEQTMERLASLGGVRSRSVSAEDVTDQLVDDEARLRNLRRTEADMLRIMDRSGDIADVLSVENQLSTVRDQIERLDAQRASLADRVSYSAIALTLTTDADAPAAEPSPAARLRDAWYAALADVREFSLALAARIFVFVAFAPYWLAGAALLAGAVSAVTAVRRGRARARAT